MAEQERELQSVMILYETASWMSTLQWLSQGPNTKKDTKNDSLCFSFWEGLSNLNVDLGTKFLYCGPDYILLSD